MGNIPYADINNLLLFGVLALQVADGWTTYQAIRLGGSEKNPVVAWLMRQIGVVPGLVLAKGAVAYIVLYALHGAPWMWAALVLYSAVVANNVRVIRDLRELSR